jgi:hypothetical protein
VILSQNPDQQRSALLCVPGFWCAEIIDFFRDVGWNGLPFKPVAGVRIHLGHQQENDGPRFNRGPFLLLLPYRAEFVR